MLRAVEGRYRDGRLELDEPVPEGVEARVVVYFPLPEGETEEPPPAGRWAAVCGIISKEDADEMIRAIEEGPTVGG